MRTRAQFRFVFALILALVTTSFCNAQQPDAENVQTLTQKAHKLAGTAKTLEEYTDALRLCGDAIKSGPTEKQKSYN